MSTEHPAQDPYLHPARLPELLALVQVLAYGRSASRGEGGIRSTLGAEPMSATGWIAMAREHPELFRVGGGRDPSASLVARHVQTGADDGSRAPLDDATVGRLITMALALAANAGSRKDAADAQLRRSENRLAEAHERRRDREVEFNARVAEERKLQETVKTAVIIASGTVAAAALIVVAKGIGLF
jgi:hypothetical protein